MSAKQGTGVELCSFFIFNSTFGPKEGEEENKIIYYHPATAEINDQVKDVGLVEALVQFARTFDSDAPVHSMQTLKQKHFFLEPEKDFFMTLVVRQPVVELTKDGAPYREYSPEAVQQPVYLALLGHMYRTYRLLRGTMAAQERDELRRSTAAIFDSYVPVLRLQQRDILDVYGGVRFLPLDRLVFLRLQSFVNQLEVRHNFVQHSVIYFRQQLVWSGLGRTNTAIVHRYLETALFPECGQAGPGVWRDAAAPTSGVFMSTEASGGGGGGAESILAPPVVHLRKHSFTAPPPGGADGDDSVEGAEPQELPDQTAQMVVYRLGEVVVVLMVDVSVRLTPPLCRDLDCSLAGSLRQLTPLLVRSSAADGGTPGKEDADSRVVYFNRCSQSQRSSAHGGDTPLDALSLMADLREDAFRFRGNGGSIFGRSTNETWVAGRVNPDREFFTVVQQKNMNLMDVNSEVERLCATQLDSIFLPA